MTLKDTQYSLIARTLHWLVAGLIISQYILAELAKNAEHSKNVVGQLALLANHKSLGMTILALAVFRVIWRIFNQPAPLPDTIPRWQHKVSNLTHWALYALIFALPITGWLMSSSFGYSVSWFNIITFPDLLATNKPIAANLNQIHELLGNLLLALAVLHVAAAFKHHFIDKDDVLRRMATLFGWLVLISTIGISVVLLGRLNTPMQFEAPRSFGVSVEALDSDPAATTLLGSELTPKASDLVIWKIDYADSFIKFSGDQAGAPFSGEWQQWSAAMQFDEEQLGASQFAVEIDATSAFSNDQERDDYIVGSDFFDAKKHAQVVFNAQEFKVNVDGSFVADAQLSAKGLTKPVEFTFTVERNGARSVLLGSATLDRLSWNIGTGDWADATWVGHDVTVSVRVAASLDE